MVGYQKFQQMNQTICTIKGTHDGNWSNICVLVVGDLYQLSTVAQSLIYMPPQTVRTLDDCTKWLGENEITWTDTDHVAKRHYICRMPKQHTHVCTRTWFKRRHYATILWTANHTRWSKLPNKCHACLCTKWTLWWMECKNTSLTT